MNIIEHDDYIKLNYGPSTKHSIIWLHGLGASGNDFLQVAQKFNSIPSLSSLGFTLPHAPYQAVTINQGHTMRAWYDIISLSVDQHADNKGIKESITSIHNYIKAEQAHGCAANKIFLAGFSQGAVIASIAALNYPERLAGVIALSGYIPQPEEVIANGSNINKTLPIFIGHGINDEIVPVTLGKKIFEILKKSKHETVWHEYTMGHSVCEQEIQDIAAWLKNQIGKEL